MYSAVNKEKLADWHLEVNRTFSSRQPLLLLLTAMLLLTGCASVAPVIKVGLVGPFEGANRAVGYDVIYSARLAVREINQAGGIDGYRVALVALDDSSDPQLAQEVAASLVVDPAVVVVIGHWTEQTTTAAAPVYAAAGLPFIPAGTAPIGIFPPSQLPANFRAAYAAVTPFDETAGSYAGSTYDAFQLIWQAMTLAAQKESTIERTAVNNALVDLSYNGMTGSITVP